MAYRNYKKNYYSKPPKKSGCKWLQTKEGKPYILGWKRLNGEMLGILISPYKNTHRVTSQNGNDFENWICKITRPGSSEFFPVLVNVRDRRAIIKKYGWVAACKTNYVGTYKRK